MLSVMPNESRDLAVGARERPGKVEPVGRQHIQVTVEIEV